MFSCSFATASAWAGLVAAGLPADAPAVVRARAWAVINGRPHFLVDNGTWAGTWVPESAAVRMDDGFLLTLGHHRTPL